MNIKNLSNSKYVSTNDVPQGQQLKFTITGFSMEQMQDGDKKPTLHGQGVKPMVLNRTNLATLGQHLGEETDSWAGGIVTVMQLPVNYQGRTVAGLRIVAVEHGPAPVQVAANIKVTNYANPVASPVACPPVKPVVVQTPQETLVHQPQTGPTVPYQMNEVVKEGDGELAYFNQVVKS